jgi:hypothetical protein
VQIRVHHQHAAALAQHYAHELATQPDPLHTPGG